MTTTRGKITTNFNRHKMTDVSLESLSLWGNKVHNCYLVRRRTNEKNEYLQIPRVFLETLLGNVHFGSVSFLATVS